MDIENIDKETAKKLLMGSILGDMCIEKNKLVSKDIVNTQSIIHRDYTELKHKIFSKFWNTGKLGISNNWGGNPNPDLRKAVRFRIYDSDAISFVENTMYKDGKRCIPDISLFSPEVMLFWYLDDGSLIKKSDKGWGDNLRIGLKSFSDQSIEKFIDDFNKKFDIQFLCEREKGKITRIYLSGKKKILKFFKFLSPVYYLIPESFFYKFSPSISLDSLNEEEKSLIKNQGKSGSL